MSLAAAHPEHQLEASEGKLVGFDPAIRTEVDLRFIAVDAHTAQVELEHRGLEAYDSDAMAMRDTFASPNGWGGMLEHYAQVAGRPRAQAPTG